MNKKREFILGTNEEGLRDFLTLEVYKVCPYGLDDLRKYKEETEGMTLLEFIEWYHIHMEEFRRRYEEALMKRNIEILKARSNGK